LIAELRRNIYELRGERETLRARVNRLEAALQDARDHADDLEEETAVLRGNISAFMDRARNVPDINRLLDTNLTHPLVTATDDLISRLQRELNTLRVEKDAVNMELEEGIHHCYEEAAREIKIRDEEIAEWQQRCAELEEKLQALNETAARAKANPVSLASTQQLYQGLQEAVMQFEIYGHPLEDRWVKLLEELAPIMSIENIDMEMAEIRSIQSNRTTQDVSYKTI
jgi:chromosome segregation ATPase